MGAITSTNVANAIVKLVAADALPVLVGNLVMGNLVNRDYEPVLAHAGDTVNIPIPPIMVANNILEGGTVQPQNPSLGNAQIVLNTHVESTFQIPDVTKVLAVPDLLKVYMQPAVAAIAQRIESDLLNLYAGFTANTPVGTAGTPITEAVVDAAETALFLAKVPPLEQKYMVVDANTYSAWRQIPRFSEFQNSGEAGLRAHCRWHDRQGERLLRIPLAVCAEDGKQSREHSQPGVHQECDGFGDPAAAATAAGHRRDRRIRRAGQFRHARGDELPAEHAGATVHGRCSVRLRRSAERLGVQVNT